MENKISRCPTNFLDIDFAFLVEKAVPQSLSDTDYKRFHNMMILRVYKYRK